MKIKILTLLILFVINVLNKGFCQNPSKYFISPGLNFNFSLKNHNHQNVYTRFGYGINFIGISDKWGMKNKLGYLELGFIQKKFDFSYDLSKNNNLYSSFQFHNEAHFTNLILTNTFYLKYGLFLNINKKINFAGGFGINYLINGYGSIFMDSTLDYNSNIGKLSINENISPIRTQLNGLIFAKLLFNPTQRSGLAVGIDYALFRLKPVYLSTEINHGPYNYKSNYSFSPRLLTLSFSYLYYIPKK